MPSFWNNVVCSLKVVTGPLVKVLRLVDREKKPPRSHIYETMDRAKDDKQVERSQQFFNIIDKIWDVQLQQPLKFYINPKI